MLQRHVLTCSSERSRGSSNFPSCMLIPHLLVNMYQPRKVTTMSPRNSRTTHPATSQQVEAKLDERRIDWEFQPNVKIGEIREVEGMQVRRIDHRAPRDQVARYATAMKHGAVFPAIVLNDRLERIDGNTRLEATEKNGSDTIPAYILHGVTTLEARSLSVELNQANGLAMTEDEIRQFIVDAVQEGETPEVKALARMTGTRETKISKWIAETRFLNRAQEVGIDDRFIEALPSSTRAALDVARLKPVFEKLTLLAAEARIPANDVKKIVAKVNGAPSQAEALDIVAAEREDRAEELRAVASGFKPRERKSAGSAQHFGALVKFNVEDLLDVAPEKQYETFARLTTIRDRLDEVVSRAEREWNLTPPEPETSTDEPTSDSGLAEDHAAPLAS